MEEFSDRLAPPYVPNLSELPSYLTNHPENNDFLSSPFLISELRLVMDSLSDSSPGPDGIVYSFLTRSSPAALSYYLDLINTFYSSGLVPDSWKEQFVIPIPKPGKDSNLGASYRPIALSSTLCKVMEHLLKNRLDWFLESRGILPRFQFGFRKGKSITDSHSILSTDIRLAFSRGESMVAVFLDISAAYDNVLLSVLRDKMSQLSISRKVVNFISNLLMFRTIRVRWQGEVQAIRHTWRGLPQGSVLSPILFNIYSFDLDKSVNWACRTLQYADDVAIYCTDKSPLRAADMVNGALTSLGSWLNVHGLSLSSAKSSAIVFSRSLTAPPCRIVFNEEPIPIVDSVKFLGVFFDRRFVGSSHLLYIAKKCERNLNILKALSGSWWGAHPYSQKLLYNAFIRSLLDFGTFIFEPCNKAALTVLERIQVRALRIVTGAMRPSPNRAVQVECVDPPLDLRRQLLADRFLFGISALSSHPLLPKIRFLQLYSSSKAYWRNKEKPRLVNSLERLAALRPPIIKSSSLPIYSVPFEALTHSSKVITNIGIDKGSPLANSIFSKFVINHFPSYRLFFTDASKLTDQGCVGAAFLLANSHIMAKFKLPPEASVFSGECLALLKALEYIYTHKLSKSVIFSDCLSALQSISLRPFKNFACKYLTCQLKHLSYKCHSAGLEVVFVWIPSHSGIVGNERADKAAKEAILDGDDSFYKIFQPDALSLPFNFMRKKWSLRWSRAKKCFYSEIQSTIPSRPWFFKNRSLSKRHTSIIIRLRLGRVCSSEQLYIFKKKDSPMCDCGNEVGNIDHIFFNCPINNKPPDLYSCLPRLNVPLPANMASLLYLTDSKKIMCAVSKFMTNNNIKL